MCDPITAITAVSAGVGIFGQIKAGKAAKKAGAQTQQSYEKVAATRMERIGYDMQQLDRDYNQNVGNALTAIGTTGISRTSFYDVLADGAAEHKVAQDALAYTAHTEAQQLRDQGGVAYQSGKDQKKASYFNAASTGVSALGGIALSGAFNRAPASGWQTTTTNAAGKTI